jgi:hypothetical protein
MGGGEAEDSNTEDTGSAKGSRTKGESEKIPKSNGYRK